MLAFPRSKSGINGWTIVSVFLLMILVAMAFEVGEAISEVDALLQKSDSGVRYTPVTPPDAGAVRDIIERRTYRFLVVALILLIVGSVLGTVLVAVGVVRSAKQSEGETTPDSGPLGMLDELGDEHGELDPYLEAELGADDFEEELLADPLDAEVPMETLEHSYNRMMDALQRVNELEKKHTVELAEANRKLEKEVAEREKAEREIRRLSRKLIDGIEDAQKKLAQDLHDEFGQTLAAFHMGLENLYNALPEESNDQRRGVRRLIEMIEQLGDKIRSISSDLRPDLLDDLGLVPTLEWYIREFQAAHPDLPVDFQAVGLKRRLNSEVELILYRIFQESLNNVVKHARASRVAVVLTYNHPKVIFMVKDDGVGFDTTARYSGIGLIGMRERAVSAGGDIEVRSEADKGTTIRVEIPVSERTET